MTGGQATSVLPSLLADETRMHPRPGQGAAEPAEASPLWPLVLLLGEIAARVERELASEPGWGPRTDEPADVGA